MSILDNHQVAQNMSQPSFDLLLQPRLSERQSSQVSCSDLHFAKVYERLEQEMPVDQSEQIPSNNITTTNELAESMFQPKPPKSPHHKSHNTTRVQASTTRSAAVGGVAALLRTGGRTEKPSSRALQRGRSLK